MSTLPSFESILLEIQQSLGRQDYQTTKKNKFATGQTSPKVHLAMLTQISQDIFDALNMDEKARADALGNFAEFDRANKILALNTWTFGVDQRQILWTLLGYFYIPMLARCVGIWSREQVLDNGMPGGRFWYIPEVHEINGRPSVYFPVTRVIDWLLDLLGISLEKFADQHNEVTSDDYEGLRRSLYNWCNGTPIRPNSIEKYFSDATELKFEGTFTLLKNRIPSEQFTDALAFIKRKRLTAQKLCSEIPMTEENLLELLSENNNNQEAQIEFVRCLAERYAIPSMSTIRQRLLLSRAVQDGYIRLLKFLCPGVDPKCIDPQYNKILQLSYIYTIVYNHTIEAWKNCKNQSEEVENTWFEKNLPRWMKLSLLQLILPSNIETAIPTFASQLTRYFHDLPTGATLEDHIGFNLESENSIIQRNMERILTAHEEEGRVLHLLERIKISSPWRALQKEHSYWVVSRVIEHPQLTSHVREAGIQRLRALSVPPAGTVPVILFELHGYLNGERKNRPKDTSAKVERLLEEAEVSEGYELYKAPILQYKAKHLLACNDFEGASKFFREAFEESLERNYGSLRAEVARDYFALNVAEQRLNVNNLEKYYREMLVIMNNISDEKNFPIEEAARGGFEYFWNHLHKPYPDTSPKKPRALEEMEKIINYLIPLFALGDQNGLNNWIKGNRSLLKSSLPDIEGNSVLMMLIKIFYTHSQQTHPLESDNILKSWRWFIKELGNESPQQLNIPDLKKQTPLMLMTEAEDTEMVKAMLQAGTDPEKQDWQGRTALHVACKTHMDSCVDALLDYPCKLDKLTVCGRSPLHTACGAGNIHAVKRLVVLAPNLVRMRDSRGQTPLELVESYLDENSKQLEDHANLCAQERERCASKQELRTIQEILEAALPFSR